jgi:hypothetical protein
MASKPKAKTYIVHHRGKARDHPGNKILGRYRVGARNENEAENLLREHVGKHAKVKVYYQEREEKKFLSHGIIVREV